MHRGSRQKAQHSAGAALGKAVGFGVDQGGDSNFGSTFSIWDYLFGTFYMPEGQLPQEYGVDDPLFPTTWAGQMIVPFQQFLARIQAPPKPSKTA